MHKEGDEVHIDTEEASGGEKNDIVRYVLIISLFLAIGVLSAIWIFGAAQTAKIEKVGDVSGQATPN